jgi:hypothetical protein
LLCYYAVPVSQRSISEKDADKGVSFFTEWEWSAPWTEAKPSAKTEPSAKEFSEQKRTNQISADPSAPESV